MHKTIGIGDVELASLIICEVEQDFSHVNLPKEMNGIEIATLMLGEMKPQNQTECLLAAQMLGVHHASVAFLKASNFSKSPEACESYGRQAVRFMSLFIEQLEAMAKLKGKTGQQKVTVEHVHVHQGGQAIVGAVTAGNKGDQGEGGE